MTIVDTMREQASSLSFQALVNQTIDSEISDFVSRHADFAYSEEDTHSLGRRFPYLGDCIHTIRWSEGKLVLADTGTHKLFIQENSWPSYPSRLLTPGEFEVVVKHIEKAMSCSRNIAAGSVFRQEMIDANFSHLWTYVQSLSAFPAKESE
jgi:hypothetical protein